jgi:hypothetical protein
MKRILFLLPLALCIGCSENDENKYEPFKPLIGEWRNIYLKIEMNSYNNSDSTRIFEATELDWEEKMNIRPIRTFFRENGTYNSAHYNLRDSLVYNPAGRWCVFGDTLIMRDTFPQDAAPYKYKLTVRNRLAEFTGIEDSDNDGKKDDIYFGRQWKQ